MGTAACSANDDDDDDDREPDHDDELEDDDEQPSAVKMLRDFGSRMEHSICSKMICEEGEDGKVRWILQDDVEEDILTTIGDSDSDRGDISGEDEWAESDEEEDAERRSPVEHDEQSLEDSRSSAGTVESEEELSDSSGISYREPQNSNTSTNSIKQDHKRNNGYKESSLSFHKSRESMNMPTSSYKDNRSHKKSLHRATNICTNESNKDHERDDDYKEKTLSVYKSRESTDMPTNKNNGNGSYGKGVDKHNKTKNTPTTDSNQDQKRGNGNREKTMPVHKSRESENKDRKGIDKHKKPNNIPKNGSRSSAAVVDSEDELSDSSGISYKEPHKYDTFTDARSKDQKTDDGYRKKSMPAHKSRESVDMPTNKCKDNGSYSNKIYKATSVYTNGNRRSTAVVESEDELSDSSGISYKEPPKSNTTIDARSKDYKRDDGFKKKSMPVHKSRESVEMPTNKHKDNGSYRKSLKEHKPNNVPTNGSRSSAPVVDSEDELSDSSGISYKETHKSDNSTDTRSKDHRRDDGYIKKSMPVHKSGESVKMPTNKYKDNRSCRKSIDKHSKPNNITTNGKSSVAIVESEGELSDSSGIGYKQPHKSDTSTDVRSKNHKICNGYEEKTLPEDSCRSRKSTELPTNKYKDHSSHTRSLGKRNKPKADLDLSSLFPDDCRKKTPSKHVQSRDAHRGFSTDIKPKTEPPSTPVVDYSKTKNSTPAKLHIHSVKKEEYNNPTKKRQSHNNVCMVEEFEDMEFLPSSSSKNRKDMYSNRPKVESPCSLKSGHGGTTHSRKSEKHRKKTERKHRRQDDIDLLEEPDEHSEMGNVTPVHHRCFSKAENPDKGVSRRQCFSVPAKRKTMALTSRRDTSISSSSSTTSKKVDLSTHEAICDFLRERPSNTKQRVKYKQATSASMTVQSVEEDSGGHRRKSDDAGLRKKQDPKERLVRSSSKDSGTKERSTASTLVMVERISSTKERLLAEPFKQKLPHHQCGSSQDESMSDRSNQSFNSLSDEYPLDQKESGRKALRSGKGQGKEKTGLRKSQVTFTEMEEPTCSGEDSDLNESGSSEMLCNASEMMSTNPSWSSTYPTPNGPIQPNTGEVEDSEESMHDEEASQLSTSDSVDENCSSNIDADHSIEMEYSDPSESDLSSQFSEDNSIKLSSAKPMKASFNASLTNTQSSNLLKSSHATLMTQHGPLHPILKTPGQSSTPCRKKKSVDFKLTEMFVKNQSILYTSPFWKSRIQKSMINDHDDPEHHLYPECHQEDKQRQETSEESLEEPAPSLPSSSVSHMSSYPKGPAIQTSTPRRDADRPRFSTPKGRKIPQNDEVPSPCTLVRDQLDNIKLGSPIQKGASPKQEVLNDQSSEEMEVNESPKCSTDWAKQSVSREQRKMSYSLRERKSAGASRILRVNNSNSSFSDVAMFSQSSVSSGEKDSILTPKHNTRSISANVLRAPKTDPRHNKRGPENRPSDITKRLNRSEVLSEQTNMIDRDEERVWLSKQPECSYHLRPRRRISSEEQEIEDSPRKTSSRQNTKYNTARGRLTETAEQLSRSVEKRRTDNKFFLTASKAKQVDGQRQDTRQWGQRHSGFSSDSETETTSSTQVSSPEAGRKRVTSWSQSSSEIDTAERKMVRGQMSRDIKVKKVTKRHGQSTTVGKSSGCAVNQKKGSGRRRIISSSDEQEDRGTPRKVSSSQCMTYNQGKERLTGKVRRNQRSPEMDIENREVRRSQRSANTVGKSPNRNPDVRRKEQPDRRAEWKRTPSKSGRSTRSVARSPTYDMR
ncbi:dentin sialophosphoprotein-like [Branchiostoma lanceolatum]|uniref:dentin sialophosphoprotein-like n=1 Tax=Branchiostoma lanceolatum TaxID=7740 RepID=UPI003456C351